MTYQWLSLIYLLNINQDLANYKEWQVFYMRHIDNSGLLPMKQQIANV